MFRKTLSLIVLAPLLSISFADGAVAQRHVVERRPVVGCASTVWVGNDPVDGPRGVNIHPAVVFLMGYTRDQGIHDANYFYQFQGYDGVWRRSRTVYDVQDLTNRLEPMLTLPPGILFQVRAETTVIAHTAC